jgi:hypothetical protein
MGDAEQGERCGWSPGLVLMVGTASAVLVLAGLKAASSFVAPAFLALVLTIAVSPLRNWLQRIGAPFWVCVAVPLITVIVVLLALGAALALSAAQLASLLPGYSHQFNELVNDVTQQLSQHGIDQKKLQTALTKLDPGQIFSFVQAFFNGLLSASSALILIVLMLVGMCLDAPGLVRQMEKLLPGHPDVVGALRGFARDTCRYLVVSTVFGAIVAVLDVLALYWFDVPVPLLWGLLAFLTRPVGHTDQPVADPVGVGPRAARRDPGRSAEHAGARAAAGHRPVQALADGRAELGRGQTGEDRPGWGRPRRGRTGAGQSVKSRSPKGPMTVRACGAARTSWATARMSSGVTASMRDSTSSTGSSDSYTSSLLPMRLIREPVSSRPSTIAPRSWPLPRSNSSSVSPCSAAAATSSRQIDRTSSTLPGWQPA